MNLAHLKVSGDTAMGHRSDRILSAAEYPVGGASDAQLTESVTLILRGEQSSVSTDHACRTCDNHS